MTPQDLLGDLNSCDAVEGIAEVGWWPDDALSSALIAVLMDLGVRFAAGTIDSADEGPLYRLACRVAGALPSVAGAPIPLRIDSARFADEILRVRYERPAVN